jgi:hypothetical protein
MKIIYKARMMREMKLSATVFLFCMLTVMGVLGQGKYRNFEVALYSRVQETSKMGDDKWIGPVWNEISSQMKVDKVYLEASRDAHLIDEATLLKAKKFFANKGIKTAGGIAYVLDEGNNFQTFCYSNPEQQKKIKEIAEFTARYFDEIILDDFFFTNCKCELCIAAKGDRSWTDFRLEQMAKVAKDLVVDPAKAVNPKVKMIIKFPNWYEHFQGCGYNLEAEPKLFDGIYTGTETRDASFNQHLQPYQGYLIYRYFNNVEPGKNGGGWMDEGEMTSMDRYAEQIWLTLFSKAPEITLFDIHDIQLPVLNSYRAKWQDSGQSSFRFDAMMKPYQDNTGKTASQPMLARAAGYTFDMVDQFLGELGNPIGVKTYKPFHSVGEDFLPTYLGMIGIPMDIVPEFPKDEPIVLLTEQARFDPDIIAKIKKQLIAGKDVMVTSGFLKEMEHHGLSDIAEIRYTDKKAMVNEFSAWGSPRVFSDRVIVIPQIESITNDSGKSIDAFDGTNGWSFLHSAAYSNGLLYVLMVPDNVTDLYYLPVEVTTRIKEILTRKLPVLMEGPGLTSLMVYDNNTVVAESFADETVLVKLRTDGKIQSLRNLQTGETISGNKVIFRQGGRKPPLEKTVFELKINPHSFVALKLQ